MKAVSVFCLAAVLLGLVCTAPCFAQSITSGDIAGTVTDPTGAVVPNAKVTVTHDATSAVHTATTNAEGFYRFPFLVPGGYTLSVSAAGFQATTLKLQVVVGQSANGNISLPVTAANTTVEVIAAPTQIDNGDISTGFNELQVSQVPNPGNDLSAIAQTAPGVVMNTQGGGGNFSTYGLPGTSNLFTLDGQNDNDPFLNFNNSGATNLLLGANEIQETTVTNNGYSGQYGQLAGAQVNYVTKSGGNQFHGNAVYQWNGRAMNANDFLSNLSSTPRPFDNVNQWAASIGGPIVKDKTFFFWDYEGLRVVLPVANAAFVPTTQFANATIANLQSNASTASFVPFYQQMFNLWNNAPGASRAVAQPISPDCAAVSAGAFPCVAEFQSTAGNFTHEYLMALRIDHKFSENDSLFGRVQTDRGVQATSTDPINSVFNITSNQPEYQGQSGWTHIVNANQVNEFKASGTWYGAVFTQANRAAALAAFPTVLSLGDGAFSVLGGGATGASFIPFGNLFPQGRNVTQYQLIDDYSWTHGNHTWKFGTNFHRNDVTDYNPQEFTAGLVTVNNLLSFFNGGITGDSLTQNFPTRLTQPISLYGLGVYLQDEWRVNRKLKVTLALRLDHNSIPVCGTDCFSRLTSPFTSLDHANSANIPYNQTILTGFAQAYPSTDIVVWQPRLGFAFSPFASNKTVIRGGVGIFGDSFPGLVADTLLGNAPTQTSFTLTNVAFAAPGGPSAAAIATNNAFQSGFVTGGTPNSIGVTPPAFTTTDNRVRQPRYQEWNLQIEQNVGWNSVLSVNYVGNHGIFEAVQNTGLNGFADPVNFPAGFGGLPTAAPDARFGTVTQIQSTGVSNYNGLTASLRHQFTHGVSFQANYTWSHALDDVSNGGFSSFNGTTDVSPLAPFNPFNVRGNYGNADYDVRHYFSTNYVWDNAIRHLFHGGPNAIFKGWTVSGTLFYRTGLPFTVLDKGVGTLLQGDNFSNGIGGGYSIPANIVGSTAGSVACGGEATVSTSPCLNINGFAAPTGLFTNQERNQFRGPNYFNTDLSVMKYTNITERASVGLGLQFFNLLNHPNFDLPINDINNGGFGTIINHVNTPTSILGSFLGGDAAPRLIQLKAEFKF